MYWLYEESDNGIISRFQSTLENLTSRVNILYIYVMDSSSKLVSEAYVKTIFKKTKITIFKVNFKRK